MEEHVFLLFETVWACDGGGSDNELIMATAHKDKLIDAICNMLDSGKCAFMGKLDKGNSAKFRDNPDFSQLRGVSIRTVKDGALIEF